MTSIGRARTRATTGGAVAALLVLAVAGGCAQPGQLGHEGSGTAPAPADGAVSDPGGPGAPEPGGPGAPEPGGPGAPEPGGPGAPEPGGPGAPEPGAPGAPEPGAPGAPEPGGPAGAAEVPDGGGQVPGAAASTAGSDARGTIVDPVQIGTPGRSEFLVRTEILQPGQSTGWITHPGTVLSVVRSGTVSVVRAQACEPARFGAEQAFFLPDGEANELRNDGPDAVVLTRSELLAPGVDERRPAEPACPAP